MRYRRALSRTAVSAAAAGLPVVPGAWWSATARRFKCDLPGCHRTGLHPAVRNEATTGLPSSQGLTSKALRHPDAVAARWRRHPYAILVPTGEACDVVDVPALLGRILAQRLEARSALGPVIAAGTRWFFLTSPGGQLTALGGEVLVHGHGSWIVLPPSLGPGGEAATWLARPSRNDWPLPARDEVLSGIPETAGSAGLPGTPGLVLPAPRRQVNPSPV